MPNNLPCPGSTTPFCAEDTRVFLHCDCDDDANKIEFPQLTVAQIQWSVQSSAKSRYSGTNGEFVSGCSGRVEVQLQLRGKWCLDPYFDEEGLNGGCVCARVYPDFEADPDKYIAVYGVVNVNQPPTVDNNSTDEAEWGLVIDALTPPDFSNYFTPTITAEALACGGSGGSGGTAPPIQGGNVLGGWTAQDTDPTGAGEFNITAGSIKFSTLNSQNDDKKQQLLNLDVGDRVFIAGPSGNIELTLTAPPTIQGDTVALTGTEKLDGTRPVAGDDLLVEAVPYEPFDGGADIGQWVAQAGAPSGNGELQIDTGSVLIHGTDNLGADMSAVLADIASGDVIYVVGETGHVKLTATGPATESGGVYTVPGTKEVTGVAPDDSDGVTVLVSKLSGTALGTWTLESGVPDASGQLQLVDVDRIKINDLDSVGDDKSASIQALSTGDKVYVVGPRGYLLQTLSADVTDDGTSINTLNGSTVTVGAPLVAGDVLNVRVS